MMGIFIGDPWTSDIVQFPKPQELCRQLDDRTVWEPGFGFSWVRQDLYNWVFNHQLWINSSRILKGMSIHSGN
jgi:hypothetical protein